MPVGPKDSVGLNVQVHGVDAHAGVSLEGLLIAPVGHARVQAADLVVVGNIKDLPTAVQVCQGKKNTTCRQTKTKVKKHDGVGKEGVEERRLTVSLAGVADLGEVPVAAALVGALGVVAHVGADTKLQTLVLV